MERYTEAKEIGKGAFGTVFIATDKLTGEIHALKELKSESKKILPELGALMDVKDHPGVVKFKGMFKTNDGSTMLTMEYCSGGNLDTFWKREKPNLEVKYAFMKEISEAVSHLHQNKIVHRDIKPENILIAPDGQGGNHPKLADFGMAKMIDGSADQKDQYMTTMAGTKFFMAPEVSTGHYNEKADVFSMGVLFRAMLFDRYVILGNNKCLADCYKAGGVHPVAWGEALNTDRNLKKQLQINARQMTNYRARNILEAMLDPEYVSRPTAKDVEVTIKNLKPEDFYVDVNTTDTSKDFHRTQSMPETSAQVPVAEVEALNLSEGASANPGDYAQQLTQSMHRIRQSQVRQPSRHTTPLRRSYAFDHSTPQFRRAESLPAYSQTTKSAGSGQLELSKEELTQAKQLIAMWETSVVGNPWQKKQIQSKASILTKSIDKIERGGSLNDSEMRSFESAWSSMEEHMQEEESDSLFD